MKRGGSTEGYLAMRMGAHHKHRSGVILQPIGKFLERRYIWRSAREANSITVCREVLRHRSFHHLQHKG